MLLPPSETTPPNNAGSLISYKFSFVYSNFDDADTSEDLAFFTLPAGAHVLACNVKGSSQFAGPGLASASAQVIGPGAAYNLSQSNNLALASAPADTNQDAMADAQNSSGSFSSIFLPLATALSVRLTTTGCNINALTAGAFDVVLTYTVPAAYPVVIA